MANTITFKAIPATAKGKIAKLPPVENYVLMDKSTAAATYDFCPYLITDKWYEPEKIKGLAKYLESQGLTRYVILCSLRYKVSQDEVKDLKEKLTEFYTLYQSPFYNDIPAGEPVITFGPALYSVIKEDTIYPVHMEQVIFSKNSFWFSRDLTSHGNYVYPADSLDTYWPSSTSWNRPIDSYKTKLFSMIIKSVLREGRRIVEYPELKKNFISSKEEFINVFYEPNKNRRNDYMAWDTETSGLHFMKVKLGCITVSFDGVEGYYIPERIMDAECKEKMNEIFANNINIGANGKFDCKIVWKNGYPKAKCDEDVIQMGHCLNELRSNSLKALAFFYSEFGGYERSLDEYKNTKLMKNMNYLEIPEHLLRDYAILDAIVTWRVWKNMLSHMRKLDEKYPNEFFPGNTIEHYYRTYKMPASKMYTELEYEGVYIDLSKLDKARELISAERDEVLKELAVAFCVPVTFKFSSSAQLGKLLEKKKWKCYGKSEAGNFKTGKEQLALWEKDGHKEAATLAKLASLDTLLEMFVGNGKRDKEDKGWSAAAVLHDDNTWRMHPDFASMMADSGRSRCSNPNMQQTPTRSKYAGLIKSSIVTPNNDDYYLATIDYASLQLRLCCEDEDNRDSLYEAFQDLDTDLHSFTAFNSFCQNKEFEVQTITVEQDGKTYTFLGGEAVITENRGEVFAKDLTEEDTLKV